MLGITNTSISQASMAEFSLSFNGTNKITYNGKAAVSLDITAAKIGAATADHTHDYLPLSGGALTGNIFPAKNGDCSIGQESNWWNSGYFNSINIDGAGITIVQYNEPDIAKCPASIIFTTDMQHTQPVWIKYNDFNAYKAPAGLTICGNQGKEYLIVDGDIKTNKGYIYTTNKMLFECGTTYNGAIVAKATVPDEITDGVTINSSRNILKWWNFDRNGCNIMLEAGGTTMVGSGESAESVKSVVSIEKYDETLFITSDTLIRFLTNCQTIGNRIESTLYDGVFTTRYLNATRGYQFNGVAGNLTATQSASPTTSMVWAY